MTLDRFEGLLDFSAARDDAGSPLGPSLSEEILGLLDHSGPDALAVLDADGHVLWMNGSARQILVPPSQGTALDGGAQDLWRPVSRKVLGSALTAARSNGRATCHIRGVFDGVTRHWDVHVSVADSASSGRASCFVLNGRETTVSVNEHRKLTDDAEHDALTGLLNRAAFLRHVADHAAAGSGLTLVLFDLDLLKRTNDTDGHAAGDAQIKHFASRLAGADLERATAARVSGDEFALAILGAVAPSRLEKSLAELCRPVLLGGLTYPCAATAGVASITGTELSLDDLFLRADLALYAAKASGGAGYRHFDADMEHARQSETRQVAFVRRAAQDRRILPHYQPKLDMESGRIVGFEALMRAREVGGQIRTAGSFAAALRDSAIVREVDPLMLGAVLADLRNWAKEGVRVSVAYNLADGQLREVGYAEKLLMHLRREGIPAPQLEVEITETVLLDGRDPTVEGNLRILHGAGVTISLDDFGTGYASLSHLKRFPIDTLKIDQSFVQNITTSPDDRAIVQAMISLADNLSMDVVAEGVETRDQHRLLQSMGCNRAQGFLYSAAVPADDARRMVAEAFQWHPGPWGVPSQEATSRGRT